MKKKFLGKSKNPHDNFKEYKNRLFNDLLTKQY